MTEYIVLSGDELKRLEDNKTVNFMVKGKEYKLCTKKAFNEELGIVSHSTLTTLFDRIDGEVN